MLRNNSDLKSWYKLYARKVEAQKSEESFSMTLRQVWRFLRDCQVIGADCTIAQFNRVYMQGKKNHFSIVPKNLKEEMKGSTAKKQAKKDAESSDEEEDELNTSSIVETEDIHFPSK